MGEFIHFPFLPEQTIDKEGSSSSLEIITEGIKLAALTAARHEQDIRVISGNTHQETCTILICRYSCRK